MAPSRPHSAVLPSTFQIYQTDDPSISASNVRCVLYSFVPSLKSLISKGLFFPAHSNFELVSLSGCHDLNLNLSHCLVVMI